MCLHTLSHKLQEAGTKVLGPLVDLGIRLFLANIFLRAAWTKWAALQAGQMDNNLMPYGVPYTLPGLTPEMSIKVGTIGIIVFSIMLVFGLFTRFSALILLGLTLGVALSIDADLQYYYWTLLFAVLVARGGGALSIDEMVIRRWCGK